MRLLFWRRDPSDAACELALGAVEAMRVEMVALHEQTLALADEAHALARAAQDRAELLQAIVLSNRSTAEMLFAVMDAERMLKAEERIQTVQGEKQ